MAWYNNIFGKGLSDTTEEKLNPAQPYYGGTVESTREATLSYERAYEQIEIVNRGVNMIVDDCAEVNVHVGDAIPNIISQVKGIKRSRVEALLNKQPNPFQDINTFRRNLFMDYLLDGNIFIYFDGVHLYHLPASKMSIHTSKSTYVDYYMFNSTVRYGADEIIHVKENSFYSIYRGVSRLKPAVRTMQLMTSMRRFQDNFFRNGAVPGLVLKSPNTLSEKIKERMLMSWQARYNPDSGGRRPLILDGGIEIDKVSNVNFKELDFQAAIEENEKIILKALGVPPILMDSGNNANLKPNMRLYYLETVLPIVKKLSAAYQNFFGFEVKENLVEIVSVQPEMSEQSGYYSSLVNAGIITPNEARKALGFGPAEGQDDIRVPANIAGSAVNPSLGGRPTEDEEAAQSTGN